MPEKITHQRSVDTDPVQIALGNARRTLVEIRQVAQILATSPRYCMAYEQALERLIVALENAT